MTTKVLIDIRVDPTTPELMRPVLMYLADSWTDADNVDILGDRIAVKITGKVETGVRVEMEGEDWGEIFELTPGGDLRPV